MTEAIAVMLSCEQMAACPADMAPTAHHLLLLHGPWLLVKLEQGWDRAHCPQARPCLCAPLDVTGHAALLREK